jgi:hypothetical protein
MNKETTNLLTAKGVKIEWLTDFMQAKAAELNRRALDIGIPIIFTSTARTIATQRALFAQGRQPLVEINRLRKIAGMWLFVEWRDKTDYEMIVTWTLKSKHLVSQLGVDRAHAFDFAIYTGQPNWNDKVNVNKNDIPDYTEVVNLGRLIGLKVGADFPKPDLPHMEQPAGQPDTA